MPRKTKPLSRRDHFITKKYLDLFADQNGQVLVFDKMLDNEYPTNTLNAAVISNFNTIVVDGVESDEVEGVLGAAEDPGVRALVALTLGALLTQEQRRDLSWFIALHFARTPTARRFNDDLAADLTAWLREGTSAFIKNTGIAIEAQPPEFSFDTTDHIVSMFDVANEGWKGLYARSWHIADVPEMLTADFPVGLLQGEHIPGLGLALGTAKQVVFATGPSGVLILAKPYGMPDEGVALSEDDTLFIRQHMWRCADRFTYRRPGTEPPTGIDLRERRVWGLQRRRQDAQSSGGGRSRGAHPA